MSITHGEMHDYAISSYFVDFENAKITLKLFWPYEGINEPDIDSIIFINVMGHDIKNGIHNNLIELKNNFGMNHNDISDIEEYTLSEYLEKYSDKILVDIANHFPFNFTVYSEFLKKVKEYNLNIYVIDTGDLGLCGWILSEKMEILLKS